MCSFNYSKLFSTFTAGWKILLLLPNLFSVECPFWFQFVTCSRDTTAYVWRLQEGRKQFQLYFSANNEPENFFRIRACR